MTGVATTPATYHLFKTCSDTPKLNKERSELFHRVTAQIIFLAQCGRFDPSTAISFLTKQAGEDKPEEDDYKKLTRVSKYICAEPSSYILQLRPPTWTRNTGSLTQYSLSTTT